MTFSTGPEGDLFCEFIAGLEEAVESIFTPELLAEEQLLDEQISTCLRSWVNGSSIFTGQLRYWGAVTDGDFYRYWM